MKKMSIGQKVFTVFNYSILIILSVSCVLPFIHLLALSLSESYAVAAGKVGLWPVDFTLSSYQFAFEDGRFFPAFWISVKRVVLGTAVNLITMILTAYPMSRPKEKLMGRNVIMTYFVITMIFSGGMIPTYLVIAKLGLLNSIWSLILPGALNISHMLILMNFIRGLPEELEDAARIDGAGSMTVLIRVVLPLMKPCLATVGLFSIIGHWNEWFGGMIYMQDTRNYPLQTYLQSLLNGFEDLLKAAESGAFVDYTEILSAMNIRTGRAAQLFMAALPIMLVYPFLQKYFTEGLTLGSVKG